MRFILSLSIVLSSLCACNNNHRDPGPAPVPGPDTAWRQIPLIQNGKVHPDWKHTGHGRFTVEGDALLAQTDAAGLGLLVYTAEKLGNCQIRIVYRSKDARSNSGVYVRIDDGILRHLNEAPPPAMRNPDGSLTAQGLERMKEASEKEVGAWYAVHHGYEVQIADGGDANHRTGSIYSLAPAAPLPEKSEGQWRTMIITLSNESIRVEVDGKPVSSFNAASAEYPPRQAWHEPRREPKRPVKGYIGLQNHDPGDVVWFKEISVRPLMEKN